MRWSPQQDAVFQWVTTGRGSALVVAVAGAGKTTTLIEAVSRMKGSVAFAAYNKKIADEIKARLPQEATNVRAGTFHSFGFGAWRRLYPKVRVNDRKVLDLIQSAPVTVPEDAVSFLLKAVSLAKQRAIGVLVPLHDARAWWDMVEHFDLEHELPEGTDTEAMIRAAQSLLEASNATCHEVVDFDDMIYAPLFHKARVWENDWVLVDEAQDTNPARRALARRMLRPGGRLLAVGDPHQAIYGFTGADNDSLSIIRREFSAVELPLTVTYRCPKQVVAEAQKYVSHITAHDSAPDGKLSSVTAEDVLKVPAQYLTPQDAILCRNTKPLVAMAFQLIRRNMACRVEGRDIGLGLIALTRKWKVNTCAALRSRLELFLERETAKLVAKGKETAAEALTDKVETLYVIMDQFTEGARVRDLQDRIRSLFGDTEAGTAPNVLTLSTVHKSKGREWDRVYLLGRAKYMPSKYARQQWQQEQEVNLLYVAVTRAKQELVDLVEAA